MSRANIDIPKDKIAEFCRKRHIRKLALFGSVLRDDFRPDSPNWADDHGRVRARNAG